SAVFARSWQMVGRREQVAAAGSYLTADVAGEPVLVVRGEDRVLRAFANVCRHRGAVLLTEPAGCAGRVRCRHHGWAYELAGGPAARRAGVRRRRGVPPRGQRAGAAGGRRVGAVGLGPRRAAGGAFGVVARPAAGPRRCGEGGQTALRLPPRVRDELQLESVR